MMARAPKTTPWHHLKDDEQELVHATLRDMCQRSLYVLNKGVLGFKDLTPSLHLPFCNFLQLSPESSGLRQARLKGGIMPRNHFKSTNSSVGKPVWLLINDPQVTINVISAVEENSIGWLGAVQRVFMRNERFQWLFPDLIPKDWHAVEKSKTRFVCRRDEGAMPEPQPSIQATSIVGGQASKHVRHVILDDPVNEMTVDSPRLVDRAVGLYKLLESTLQDYESSTIDLVATPWGFGDVVEYALENEVAEGEMLLWKIGCYGEFYCSPEIALPEFVPANIPMDGLFDAPLHEGSQCHIVKGENGGKPIFPERYPVAELERIEKKYGPFLFSCNYRCAPFDPSQSGFKPDYINYFTRELDGSLNCTCKHHPKCDHALGECHVVMTVDPAWSDTDDAAESAICIMALAPDGCRFLLKAWSDKVEPDALWDEIVHGVAEFAPYLVDVGIESVASQKLYKFFYEHMLTLKDTLPKELRDRIPEDITIHDLKPENQERAKIRRIKAQQLYLGQGQWHFLPGMTKFLEQYNKFPRARPVDILDAWAYGDEIWSPKPKGTNKYHSSNWNKIQMNAVKGDGHATA